MSRGLGKETVGLKKRITCALQALEQTQAVSMGELISMLDLDKALASEVSSALYKLRQEGRLRVSEGTATSGLGKRVVRRYSWLAEPVAVRVVAIPAPHPLNSLFLRRG